MVYRFVVKSYSSCSLFSGIDLLFSTEIDGRILRHACAALVFVFNKLGRSAFYIFKYVMKEHMESTAPRIVLRTDVTCVTMLTDPARVYLDGKDPLTVMKVCINYSLANK